MVRVCTPASGVAGMDLVADRPEAVGSKRLGWKENRLSGWKKLGGTVESMTVEVGEGGGGELNVDNDESGGSGDGEWWIDRATALDSTVGDGILRIQYPRCIGRLWYQMSRSGDNKKVLPAYAYGEENGNAASEAGQHQEEEELGNLGFT